MIRCWTILLTLRALMSGNVNGHVVVSRTGTVAQTGTGNEAEPLIRPEENLCKKCLCRVNSGCFGFPNAICRSLGPMCCCCMPGLFPCTNMADLLQYPDDDSLGALEEGLEDIGRLEK